MSTSWQAQAKGCLTVFSWEAANLEVCRPLHKSRNYCNYRQIVEVRR